MTRWGKWAAGAAAFVGAAALAVPMVVSAQAGTTTWRATLSGANEVPANASTATGTFTATLDESAGTLAWTLSVPAITNTTAAHIHAGAAGANGGIVVNLFAAPAGAPASTITASGTARSADTIGTLAGNFPGLVTALKAGTLYVNVHTSANPGGEIRAQITSATATPAPTAVATAAPAQAAPTAAATAIAAPKSGTGGYLNGSGMSMWALAALAVVAAGVALGAGFTPRRRDR
jgi:CHRD domain